MVDRVAKPQQRMVLERAGFDLNGYQFVTQRGQQIAVPFKKSLDAVRFARATDGRMALDEVCRFSDPLPQSCQLAGQRCGAGLPHGSRSLQTSPRRSHFLCVLHRTGSSSWRCAGIRTWSLSADWQAPSQTRSLPCLPALMFRSARLAIPTLLPTARSPTPIPTPCTFTLSTTAPLLPHPPHPRCLPLRLSTPSKPLQKPAASHTLSRTGYNHPKLASPQ